MSPLDRLAWLCAVRDAEAPQCALAVAIDIAYRAADGGAAWGRLGGAGMAERTRRKGRAWLEAHGFLLRISAGWQPIAGGTSVPESGTPVPQRHACAGKRHAGAGETIETDSGTPVPESGTLVPPGDGAERHTCAGVRHAGAGKAAPACRPSVNSEMNQEIKQGGEETDPSPPKKSETDSETKVRRSVTLAGGVWSPQTKPDWMELHGESRPEYWHETMNLFAQRGKKWPSQAREIFGEVHRKIIERRKTYQERGA